MSADELARASQLKNTAFLKPEQISNKANILKTGIAATGKTQLGILGLSNPVTALGTAGISGTLGYAGAKLRGSRTPFYEAGLMAGGSLPYAGINRLTAPIQNNVIKTLLPRSTNVFARGITRGLVQGAGNIAENIAFTPLVENRKATREELAIAGATGLLFGVGEEAVGTALNRVKQTIKTIKPNASEKEIETASRKFIRDEVGRFAKQGYEKPQTKFVKDPFITDAERIRIRKELGLPKDPNIPIGFQAKPTRPILEAEAAKNEKLKVGGGEFGTERFNVNQTLDTTIRDTAKKLEPDIAAARGGTKSFEDTLNDAKKISLDDLLGNKGGHSGDAKVFAASSYIKQYSEKIDQLRALGANINPLQKAELESAQANLDKLIVKTFGEISPEAGRTLKAHQYLAEVISDPQIKLKNFVARNTNLYPQSEAVIKGLNAFDPEDKIGMIKYLRDAQKVDNISKLESIWYNNILSGTSTHIANTIGNLGRTMWHLATKPFRVAVDTAGSALTGKPREEFLKETMPELVGATKGFRDGVRRATFAFKNGIRESDVAELNVPSPAFKGKVGAVIETPSRLLIAGDELFRGINRTIEIYRQAASIAAKEGLSGTDYDRRVADLIDSPTTEMIKNANDLASKLLFQDVSKELSAVGGLRDLFKFDLPKIGTVRPMKFVIPFIQTPVNVAKFAIEASPLGFAQTAVSAKNMTKQELNRRLASNLMGTAATAALATYFVEGSLTAKAPSGKDGDAFYAEGKLPYAAKIGNTWVQYNRLPEPLASQLTNLALLHDQFKKNPDASLSEKASAYTLGFLRSMADRTFLSGIGDFMDAVEDPDRYGKNFLQNLAAGFVPGSSLVGSVARATDRTVRDPQDIGQAIQSKIPGLSQNVPARTSEVEPGGVATRKPPGYQEFIPIKTSQETPLSIEQYSKLSAKNAHERLKKLDKDEANRAYKLIKKDNPTLATSIKKLVTLDKLEATPRERKIADMVSVKDRSQEIFKEAEKLETKEEKNALIKRYKELGIATDAVIEELKNMIQNK